ncbi:MAG: polysialyltransferase family glycosyltransferase [Pseudomonadota bacterium]
MTTAASDAEPPETGVDLFVATTFGQVRNAAAIAAETGRDSRVLLITAANNRQLAARMIAHCEELGLRQRDAEAPVNGAMPLRRVVRAYHRLAADVFAETKVARLWLSNGDQVFSVLADAAERAGAVVNFYEDGLSCYRRVDDPSFRSLSFKEQATLSGKALRHQFGRIGRAITGAPQGQAGLRAEVRDLFHKIGVHAELLALASAARPLLAKGPYFERRRAFEEAWVAFPEALDPGMVSARRLRAIRPSVSADTVKAAKADAVGAAPALYLSQTYGNSFEFYAAVAEALKETGEPDICLKFHPREKDLRRTRLCEELTRRGVRWSAPDALDAYPAEALFATGAFRDVYGLTSTALLLGHAVEGGPAFHLLGRRTLALARADAANAWRYDRLESDIALFERLWRTLDETP